MTLVYAAEDPDEALQDLRETRKLGIADCVLGFCRPRDVLDQSGEELADAELDDP